MFTSTVIHVAANCLRSVTGQPRLEQAKKQSQDIKHAPVTARPSPPHTTLTPLEAAKQQCELLSGILDNGSSNNTSNLSVSQGQSRDIVGEGAGDAIPILSPSQYINNGVNSPGGATSDAVIPTKKKGRFKSLLSGFKKPQSSEGSLKRNHDTASATTKKPTGDNDVETHPFPSLENNDKGLFNIASQDADGRHDYRDGEFRSPFTFNIDLGKKLNAIFVDVLANKKNDGEAVERQVLTKLCDNLNIDPSVLKSYLSPVMLDSPLDVPAISIGPDDGKEDEEEEGKRPQGRLVRLPVQSSQMKDNAVNSSSSSTEKDVVTNSVKESPSTTNKHPAWPFPSESTDDEDAPMEESPNITKKHHTKPTPFSSDSPDSDDDFDLSKSQRRLKLNTNVESHKSVTNPNTRTLSMNKLEFGEHSSELVSEDSDPFLDIDISDKEKIMEMCRVKGIDASVLNYRRPNTVNIEIAWTEFSSYYDTELKQLIDGYALVVDDALQKIDFPCSYNAKKKRKLVSGNDSFTVIGKCGGKCTSTFKGKIQKIRIGRPVRITFEMEGEFKLLQKFPTGRDIRGKARESMKGILKREKPFSVFVDRESRILSRRFLHNNHAQKSKSVLRNIRAEGKITPGRTGNVIVDLGEIKKQQEMEQMYASTTKSIDPGYVRLVSLEPFFCTFFSPLQVQYATICDEWFIDATGSIVRKVNNQMTLLHTVIGRCRSGKETGGAPIAEFLLNKSDTFNIQKLIEDFFTNVKKLKPDYKPKRVTCDFSFAYLHALCAVLNKESLVDGINRCFRHMENKEKGNPMEEVKISVCRLHVINAFSSNLKKHHVSDEIRKFALHGLAKIQEAGTWTEVQEAVTCFITTFGNEELPEDLVNALSHDLVFGSLQHPLPEQASKMHLTMRSDEELDELIASNELKLQREKSLFFQYFVQREKSISRSEIITGKKIKNPLFNEDVIKLMRNVYFPYFNFWSNLSNELKEGEKMEGPSTAPVESYFKTHKHSLHDNLREDPVLYIKEHGPKVQGMINNALSLRMSEFVGGERALPQGRKDLLKKDLTEEEEILRVEELVTAVGAKELWNKTGQKSRKSVYQNRSQKMFFSSSKGGEGVSDMTSQLQKLIAGERRKMNKKKNESDGEEGRQTVSSRVIKKKPKKKVLPKDDKEDTFDPQESIAEPQEFNIYANAVVADTENRRDKERKARRKRPDLELQEMVENHIVDMDDPGPMVEAGVDSVHYKTILSKLFHVNLYTGTEEDVITLLSKEWLNGSVVHANAMQLLEKYGRKSPGSKRLDMLLESCVIRRNVRKEKVNGKTTEKATWKVLPFSCPYPDVFEVSKGRLFYPTFDTNHWWLTVVNFQEQLIQKYDSGIGFVAKQVVEQHYKMLRGHLEASYGVKEDTWSFEEVPVSRQNGGHECGDLMLANTEAVLKGRDPLVEVKASGSASYRTKILRDLLKTDINGNALLRNMKEKTERETASAILIFLKLRSVAQKNVNGSETEMKQVLQNALELTGMDKLKRRINQLNLQEADLKTILQFCCTPSGLSSYIGEVDACPQQNLPYVVKQYSTEEKKKQINLIVQNMSQDELIDAKSDDWIKCHMYPDFPKKKHDLYVHSQKIKNLNHDELRSAYPTAKEDVDQVVRGRRHSLRMKLFEDGKMAELSNREVYCNFNMQNLSWLMSRIVVDYPSRNFENPDFVKKVIMPELHMRLYADLNGIQLETAERELLYGAEY